MTETEERSRDARTAVDKAVSVLKAFGRDAHIGIGVSELSRRTGLSKSTTFRLLGMLERNGVVERAGTAYRLGRIIEELGAQTETPVQNEVRDLLTPFLAELYVATHATVQLGMLVGTSVVYLNKLEGPQRLHTPSRIGGRMPAYCTAVGKALLASDPLATDAALREPRHAWTLNTITEEVDLLNELDRVRKAGIAHDRGESLESLACLAAPVRGAHGRVIAALSISGDASNFQPMRYERILRAVAFSASRAITAHSRIRDAAAVA